MTGVYVWCFFSHTLPFSRWSMSCGTLTKFKSTVTNLVCYFRMLSFDFIRMYGWSTGCGDACFCQRYLVYTRQTYRHTLTYKNTSLISYSTIFPHFSHIHKMLMRMSRFATSVLKREIHRILIYCWNDVCAPEVVNS